MVQQTIYGASCKHKDTMNAEEEWGSPLKSTPLKLGINEAPHPPTTSLLGLHVLEYRRRNMLGCIVQAQSLLQLPFSRCECLEAVLDIAL